MEPPKIHPVAAERAEHELLICVARRRLNPERDERILQLLQQDLDWDYLLRMANRHGVLPLLYHHLSAIEEVPSEVIADLRDANYEISRSNFSLTGELIKLMEFLHSHDVRAIPFKGPALALWAYADPGLRQFIDLDLLVRRRDVAKVSALLGARGFKPDTELTGSQTAALLRFGCALNLSNESGVVLDVHWALLERHHAFDVDIDEWWDRLEPVNVAGRELLTLSPEDLLLVLCLHGFTHSWERLGWIADIAGLVQSGKRINWHLVEESAKRIGARRVVALGIMLARDLLDAPLPPALDNILDDSITSRVAEEMSENLFARELTMDIDSTRGQIMMRERLRDKIAFAWRYAVTPRVYDCLYWSVPDPFWFLHYPARQVRLATKFSSRLMNGKSR